MFCLVSPTVIFSGLHYCIQFIIVLSDTWNMWRRIIKRKSSFICIFSFSFLVGFLFFKVFVYICWSDGAAFFCCYTQLQKICYVDGLFVLHWCLVVSNDCVCLRQHTYFNSMWTYVELLRDIYNYFHTFDFYRLMPSITFFGINGNRMYFTLFAFSFVCSIFSFNILEDVSQQELLDMHADQCFLSFLGLWNLVSYLLHLFHDFPHFFLQDFFSFPGLTTKINVIECGLRDRRSKLSVSEIAYSQFCVLRNNDKSMSSMLSDMQIMSQDF